MSTNLGPHLPETVQDFFRGDDLTTKVGPAAVLVTLGEDGYPHPCLVTPGELLAGDGSTLRLALYEQSTATRNLRARPTATLCHAQDGAGYYVKVDVSTFPSSDPALEGLATFTLQVRHVLKDSEEGAEVTSSFQFRDLAGSQACVERWLPVVSALRSTFTSV